MTTRTITIGRGTIHHFDLIWHSLNREKRQRELLEITRQNQAIMQRIEARQANFSHEAMVLVLVCELILEATRLLPIRGVSSKHHSLPRGSYRTLNSQLCLFPFCCVYFSDNHRRSPPSELESPQSQPLRQARLRLKSLLTMTTTPSPARPSPLMPTARLARMRSTSTPSTLNLPLPPPPSPQPHLPRSPPPLPPRSPQRRLPPPSLQRPLLPPSRRSRNTWHPCPGKRRWWRRRRLTARMQRTVCTRL